MSIRVCKRCSENFTSNRGGWQPNVCPACEELYWFCRQCDTVKPWDEFTSKNGYRRKQACRECAARRHNESRWERSTPKICKHCGDSYIQRSSTGIAGLCRTCRAIVKQCGRCGEIKLVEYFSKRTETSSGRVAHCHDCRAERWTEVRDELGLRRIEKKYGLPAGGYENLMRVQGGRCAICRRTPEEVGRVARRFSVDHDHGCCPEDSSCGECVRGLLCGPCNTAIGQFAENEFRIRSALQYLQDAKFNSDAVA